MDRIGNTIRELRKELGLSLKELAEKIGATSSFVSQVENDKAMPSLPVLKKIADALGTKISVMLGEEEEKQQELNYLVIKKDERKTLKNFGEGLQLQFLSTLAPDNMLEPTIHVLEPKMISGTPPYHHEGQEFIIVLKGKIILGVGDKAEELEAGDTCYFDSKLEHYYENILEDGQSEVLCVSSPGYF